MRTYVCVPAARANYGRHGIRREAPTALTKFAKSVANLCVSQPLSALDQAFHWTRGGEGAYVTPQRKEHGSMLLDVGDAAPFVGAPEAARFLALLLVVLVHCTATY